VVIGHTAASPGARNPTTGTTEFQFNEALAWDIQKAVAGVGSSPPTVTVLYRVSLRGLPMAIDAQNPDFIVSLHCNAFNAKASGTEMLYYHKSPQGLILAGRLQNRIVPVLDLKNRGLKPQTSEDRGGYLLRYTRAPCVIAEPFFIDNTGDLYRAQGRYSSLVGAYAGAIEEYAQRLASIPVQD
jgi:N-acetylmuramoyl-L-alanine amidase